MNGHLLRDPDLPISQKPSQAKMAVTESNNG
jgi:hypothetical protein